MQSIHSPRILIVSCLLAVLAFAAALDRGTLLAQSADEGSATQKCAPPSPDLRAELIHYRHKLVYETNRDGNWELYVCNADGSHPVNLTRTPDVGELYPKPSPDGTKI